MKLRAIIAALLVAASPSVHAATFYVQTTGASTNSGSTDQDAANLTGSSATNSTVTVTLDGSPDLSGLVTAAGPTQSTIYLFGATVTNRRIFKISGFDNTAKTVTVDADPTCAAGACGAWSIGGRIVWPSGSTAWSSESSVTAGDVVQFNDTPATRSGIFFTFRNAGNVGSGWVKVMGKPGVRPVLTNTANSNTILMQNVAMSWVENFEIVGSGPGGDCINMGTLPGMVWNVKITDCGGGGIITGGNSGQVYFTEISGAASAGFASGVQFPGVIFGSYIHNNGSNGIQWTASAGCGASLINSIVSSNTGSGVVCSGTGVTDTRSSIQNSVIYNNGINGLSVADVDNPITITNSIFYNNGNAGGEYNVNMVSGSQIAALQFNNIFWHTSCQGGAAGACVNNYTLRSTEVSADPQFVNAAGGNFNLGTTSPGASLGFPTAIGINTSPTMPSYPDIGAMQRAVGAGAATILSIRPGLQ